MNNKPSKGGGGSYRLIPAALSGSIRQIPGRAPLKNAHAYEANATEASIVHRFPAGTLTPDGWITADILVQGRHRITLAVVLREGDGGPSFEFSFTTLTECAARLRLPLSVTNLTSEYLTREGALLNVKTGGARINLSRVNRLFFVVRYKNEDPARWCMTGLQFMKTEPKPLRRPLLAKGLLLDELGQSATWNWPGKSKSPRQVISRLRNQLAQAPGIRPLAGRSRWGGWLGKRFDATGFFRTQKDKKRWWLVDPEGYAFWSAGPTCVFPDTSGPVSGLEHALTWIPARKGTYAAARDSFNGVPGINYLIANFIRAFGPDAWREKWETISLGHLRAFGFNTIANWSDCNLASSIAFPYVRQLEPTFSKTPKVYRDFPDVFHPSFNADAAAFAAPLRETVDDPALLGYFLMNEPGWGFSSESPAIGMLYSTDTCECRRKLAEHLKKKYATDKALSNFWGQPTSFAAIAKGRWTASLTAPARLDLDEFSGVMTERLFGGLRAACRTVDPVHLNLGARYCSCVPPEWALRGMSHFDVFSINWYQQRMDEDAGQRIAESLDRPILGGEFQFGALDVGLPSGGLKRVRGQKERGAAYRVYVEDAAAKPWCVGAHWFQFYDQAALGRFDGENFNIGFLDICNRPYEPLARAARATHERLYLVASGKESPFSQLLWYHARP